MAKKADGAHVFVENFEEEFSFSGRDTESAFKPVIRICGTEFFPANFVSKDEATRKAQMVASVLGVNLE